MIDTHAHIHFPEYDVPGVLNRSRAAGVEQVVTVGINAADSARAVDLAARYDGIYATVGLHPHEAQDWALAKVELAELVKRPQVVAIGECGLDYFRNLSNRQDQERAFRDQIELAFLSKLPLVFHVRDAFPDFLKIVDEYPGIKGVVHCFSGGQAEMESSVERGLRVALNGIMTFTKDQGQLAAARALPLDRLLLETDCPFLSPAPKRGERNQPANLPLIAEFLAELRGETLEQLAAATTENTRKLFGLPPSSKG
jgi:TatD DNase family protein